MLIDSHAHLEMAEFDGDRDLVVQRAVDSGVGIIVTVGTNLADCRKAVTIAARFDSVYAALGIHPHDAKEIGPDTYDQLKEMAKSDKVVAYGEIGLDFFRDPSPRELQIRRCEEQLELAVELALPVIIHDREAHDEIMRLLSPWKGKGGIVHCFSGDMAMARRCIDMGFLISIPGAVTFNKAEEMQKVARGVPLDSLLVETDSPFLSPQPHRGKRNEPSHVVHTARRIAEIRGITFDELAAATTANARRIFNLPQSL
ncbi:MAG: TatD family hydrolase [Smithellaceae bacterium]|nr:TatD family hydrolase [Smithellaceae bacterium]